MAQDPCRARGQTTLGGTVSREQQWAEAPFRKSINCDGGFLDGYVQLAPLLRGPEKFDECSTRLAQALRQFPIEWRLHDELGKVKQG